MRVEGEVFLIKMPWHAKCEENLIPPLGLGSLSEAMQQAGIDHEIYDLAAVPEARSALLAAIRDRKPAVAAVSFGSAGYLRTYAFLEEVKRAHPAIRVIVGGWHPSSVGAAIFDACPAVDVSVLGPGERALIAVLRDEATGLGNVLTRGGNLTDGQIRLTECLDRGGWAFPRYAKMDLSPYALKGVRGILTSRGCPSQCTFCSSRRVSGLGYLAREVDDIAAEFEYHLGQGVRTFQILDDNMSLKMDRAMAIFEMILRLRERVGDLSITLPNGIRADRCCPELLTMARQCGVTILLFGIESADDRMLAAMKKGQTLDTIRRAVLNAFNAGLQVRLAFLLGMPGETLEEVYRSMAFVRSFGRTFDDIYVNHPIPFPGTELYQTLTEAGYLTLPPSEYLNCGHGRYFGVEPIFETPELSFADRHALYGMFQQLRMELCPTRRPAPARAPRRGLGDAFRLLFSAGRLLRRRVGA
ncbi:MAG: B12-binding domain-containing radical SAM protein [Planctomycetota bacterium]